MFVSWCYDDVELRLSLYPPLVATEYYHDCVRTTAICAVRTAVQYTTHSGTYLLLYKAQPTQRIGAVTHPVHYPPLALIGNSGRTLPTLREHFSPPTHATGRASLCVRGVWVLQVNARRPLVISNDVLAVGALPSSRIPDPASEKSTFKPTKIRACDWSNESLQTLHVL